MSVKLMVWHSEGGRPTTHTIEGGHAEANRLVRGAFSGLKCKIVNNNQRDYTSMRSACDKVWGGQSYRRIDEH